MTNIKLIGLAAVGAIVITKGKILSAVWRVMGLGSQVADTLGTAVEGVGLVIDVTENAVGVSATWLAEQYYFDGSMNSDVIKQFHDKGLTGSIMLDTLEYIEGGKLQIFKDVVTRETCANFWMDLIESTTGYSQWAPLNTWANAQLQIVMI